MFPQVIAIRLLQLTATDSNQPAFVQKHVANLIELMETYLSLPLTEFNANMQDSVCQAAFLTGKIQVTVELLLDCFKGIKHYESLYLADEDME